MDYDEKEEEEEEGDGSAKCLLRQKRCSNIQLKEGLPLDITENISGIFSSKRGRGWSRVETSYRTNLTKLSRDQPNPAPQREEKNIQTLILSRKTSLLVEN